MRNGIIPRIQAKAHHAQGVKTLSWGLFLIIAAAAAFIAMGIPLGPITLLAGIVGLLFAFTYPYAAFGLLIALIPFLGITVSIPVNAIPFGEQAFGGSIDIYVGEVVAIILLITWALKVIFLWVRRNDVNWKPWLPLALPMGAIVATHILSLFSPLHPDAILVIKYAIRPVLTSYLVYVALTVNFVRSPRRVRMVLGIVVATGVFAALNGFASLGISDPGQAFPRARPLFMFGTHPLGDNHNLLAEWLSFTSMASLALISLTKSKRLKRLLGIAVAFQVVIALLTFARSLWIVMAFQAALLAFTVWREELKKYAPMALMAILLLIPLGIVMAAFSATPTVQSSTSTRWMLTEIAFNYWEQSPIIGAGAGTFVNLVERTSVFFIEYGNPMDSHGWIQKLLAETGMLGFLAVAWFVIAAYQFMKREIASFPVRSHARNAILILSFSALGSLLYQLFNTNYWTGKLWLPLGIAIAATRALRMQKHDSSPEPLDDQ